MFEAREFIDAHGYKLLYRLYVPADYDASQSYPLVLFLHGAGERGDDNTAQLRHGVCEMFKHADSPIHGCIVVAPQCPAEAKWVGVRDWPQCIYSTDEIPETDVLKAAFALLSEICATYNINDDRIYVTGLSMGGYGTWDLLVRHGDAFAAALPICGGCDVSKAPSLVDIPIWTYHGALDDVVPPTGTRAMAEAIVLAGGRKFHYTELPQGYHGVWNGVYGTGELIEWLLSHKRSDR